MSDRQIFLVSPWSARISNGPAATVSIGVPDLHYYCNRGGKDAIPLYRDGEGNQANVTAGLLDKLAEELGLPVSPEDLMAYCFAVIAHPGYTETFHDQLENDPVHVPITSDPQLFSRAVSMGHDLLWLQTFGTRFTNEDRPHGRLPRRNGLVWLEPVTAIPEDLKAVQYDAHAHQLHVGDGVVGGVSPEVRHFEVSGMNVLDKWLGARTRKGIGKAAGKAAKPLDRIRPTEWEDEWNDELLDLLRVLTATVEKNTGQADLLDQILAGPLIEASALPVPTAAERKVPKTIKRDSGQVDLTEHPTLID